MTDGNDNTDDNILEEDKNKLPEDEDKNKQQEEQNPPKLTEEQRIQALVDAALKPIKEKLNSAYGERDELNRKVKEFEKRDRDTELKRLEDEGKVKEAYEGRLADSEAARQVAEKRVVELTRDLELKNVLVGLNFRNDRARDVAFKEIVAELVQDDKGEWQHKSGTSIADAVKKFADNEANTFLFKSKASSGGGSDTAPPVDTKKKASSVFGMTQAEVLARAAEGTLPKRR